MYNLDLAQILVLMNFNCQNVSTVAERTLNVFKVFYFKHIIY